MYYETGKERGEGKKKLFTSHLIDTFGILKRRVCGVGREIGSFI